MSTDSRRQCWECQRRRLVCDSTYPVCIQCRTTRITCPGYEDKRPLVWLAPGRVTSRTRRRPRKGAAAPSKLKVSKSGTAKTNEKQTQDLAVAPLTQAAVQDRVKIPKLVLKTERCDIYSAAHYCKYLFPTRSPGPFVRLVVLYHSLTTFGGARQ